MRQGPTLNDPYLPDQLIVKGLGRKNAANLVGLLHFSQHLDDVHHTDCQLLGGEQLIRQVLLQRLHYARLQKLGRVLSPPLEQAVLAAAGRHQDGSAQAGDEH